MGKNILVEKLFIKEIKKIKKDLFLFMINKVSYHYKILPKDLVKQYTTKEIKEAFICILFNNYREE